MKKSIRRGIALLLAVVLLGFPMMELKAEEVVNKSSEPSDVFIVIDNSWSMKDTDPERLAIQCADAFMAPGEKSETGVLTFSGKVEKVEDLVVNIGKDEKYWDSVYTQTGENTNIGGALRVAGNKLISDGANNSKAIILITDGVSKSGEAYEPIQFNGKPIPVYCIFINDGKSENEEGARAFLNDVAVRSGTEQIYEITSGNQISDEMEKIKQAIYKIKGGERGFTHIDDGSAVQPITIGDDIYEFIGEIKHDTAATFALTVIAPDGTALYENKKPANHYVTCIENKALTSIGMLWPAPGEYQFVMESDKKQVVEWSTISIMASLNLSLDKNQVKSGEEVIASYSVKEDMPLAAIKQASLRIHDQSGLVLDDSLESGTNITANSDGTFAINTENLTDGAYDVVVIAEMDDGTQYASVRVPLSISGTKSSLPLPLPALIAIGAVLLALIVFLLSKLLRSPYVDPAKGMLNVNIRERKGHSLICTVPIRLPGRIPGGKPTNLRQLLMNEHKHYNPSLDNREIEEDIPAEIADYSICCKGEKNGKNKENQNIIIYDKNKKLVLQIAYNSSGEFNVREDDEDSVTLQFKWAVQKVN